MMPDSTPRVRRPRWPWYIGLLGAAMAGLVVLATLDRRAMRVLEAAGYDRQRDGSPTEFFAARARRGLTRAEVARAMPRPARVEHFLDATSTGDSVLLERYVYEDSPSGASWEADIYYGWDGRVDDVYAQDRPGTSGARRVTEREVEEWLRRSP